VSRVACQVWRFQVGGGFTTGPSRIEA
jgi:hypothetical protein